MRRFWCPLMTEQSGPKQIVGSGIRAEEAGFTDVAVVHVGDVLQQRFLDEVVEPLLERLRAAAPKDRSVAR